MRTPKPKPTLNVTAQQFACAMLMEAQIAALGAFMNQLENMGLSEEAAEIVNAVDYLGRRRACIEEIWQRRAKP